MRGRYRRRRLRARWRPGRSRPTTPRNLRALRAIWTCALRSLAACSGGLAAVDDHGVADRERCLVRAEPQDGGGDLLGTTHPADRLLGDHRGAAFVSAAGEAAHHLGIDDARAD